MSDNRAITVLPDGTVPENDRLFTNGIEYVPVNKRIELKPEEVAWIENPENQERCEACGHLDIFHNYHCCHFCKVDGCTCEFGVLKEEDAK